MGSSGSRCTQRYLATKKEKNNNKKRKKEIGHNFLIDFLFFTPHEKKNLYISQKKMDRPQNWLEMIGWKAFWLKK